MEILEGKDSLIKNNIARDIDATGGDLKALDPFVSWCIA
jgi:hypothetical protein